MKCFYHNDMDGKCAGAIVYNYWKDRGETVECIPMDYSKEFPFDIIKPGEQVYIVDFSLQKTGEFEKLMGITRAIIWIDHHKTAIEKHKHLADFLVGKRKDGVAGCVLTWEYFYGRKTVPRVVELLGDYDTWTYKFGDETSRLQAGIQIYYTNPESDNWIQWLKINSINYLLNAGEVVLKYQENFNKILIDRFMFRADFEGYKAVCCNAGSVSSKLFDCITEDYDLMIPFVFNGKTWTVSLYTKKDIDVSEIAKKYGGGGHKSASGFQCAELPFKIKK